jgi:hypothetical protein
LHYPYKFLGEETKRKDRFPQRYLSSFVL